MHPPCNVRPADELDWLSEVLAMPVPRPCWRVWRYREAAVVLGHGQQLPRGKSSLPFLRRPTGGGAVLVGPWMLGTDLVLPARHPWVGDGLVSAYRRLGLAHAAWLRKLGVPAEKPSRHSLPPAPGMPGWACFSSLSSWEVAVRGCKLVGLAQARRAGNVLVSAGALITPAPWQYLCLAVGADAPLDSARALRRFTTSCEQEIGQPVDPGAYAEALHDTLSVWLREPSAMQEAVPA